ncbi:MAG: tricarballylate utilization 4Fe-4S protein TcuB [Spongiibacteraceae bacterium]|nr:tricarballylate utilization 4Fe-4S protein TcuB [Spongiibacteraceae bacterium]
MSTVERIQTIEEASLLMTICNACHYCEGHCAVFPAMERRLVFNDSATIDYLSNLCHQCGACYHHCQYAEPHEFNVNAPKIFEQARYQSYAEHAWPGFMSKLFEWGMRFSVYSLLASIIIFIGAVVFVSGPDSLIKPVSDSFYSVIPHEVMASIFGALGFVVLLTWFMSARHFWCALSLPHPLKISWSIYGAGFLSALSLKNLDGGHGLGCYVPDEAPSLAKRRFHHLTMYGFLACFAATSVGTAYHYLFGWPAPYGWLSLPKLLGVGGGIAMLIGIPGLFFINQKTEKAVKYTEQQGLGQGLMLLLFVTTLTGLLLPLLAGSSCLALMLCIHLGAVSALFLNFAWGKFIHGIYRLIALIADAYEKSSQSGSNKDASQ